MYESSFQLDRQPFVAAPLLDFYFPSDSIEAARLALTASIQRGAGPGLVIGPAGTGKTLLAKAIAHEQLSAAAIVGRAAHDRTAIAHQLTVLADDVTALPIRNDMRTEAIKAKAAEEPAPAAKPARRSSTKKKKNQDGDDVEADVVGVVVDPESKCLDF